MSITLNNSDFQCLQDQLLELKTKNYELAEKNRRSQADFEAAKAKICALQLKLEEQERDFQVTSTTLRREIEAVTGCNDNNNKDNKDEDHKAKYKKLLGKAKELQQRSEKQIQVLHQLDVQNKNLNEKVRLFEEENLKLKENLDENQKKLDVFEKEYHEKFDSAMEEYISKSDEEKQKLAIELEAAIEERETLKKRIEDLATKVLDFDHRLETQAEERRIHERKGLQIVKELKRQLVSEKNRTETLQKRLEALLSEPPIVPNASDLDGRSRLSTSSSTNGNSSSNGNGSRANQDANSVGSWSFVPVKTKSSNPALNETLSLCSIDSEDRETVQQPCDTRSENSIQPVVTADSSPIQTPLSSTSYSSPLKQASTTSNTPDERLKQSLNSPSYPSSRNTSDGMLIEEQAVLVDRLTRLQHDKWMLEEKLSYLEQANSSLSEDLANKSDVIKHYFLNQALKTSGTNHSDAASSIGSFNLNNNHASRRISFPNNMNHLISEKPSLKKVVDFLRERSQVSSVESENISREATKKMQLMLEETLIKCLKLQENLDFVSSELNKFKS